MHGGHIHHNTGSRRCALVVGSADSFYVVAVDRDFACASGKHRVRNVEHHAVRTSQLHGLGRHGPAAGDFDIQAVLPACDRDAADVADVSALHRCSMFFGCGFRHCGRHAIDAQLNTALDLIDFHIGARRKVQLNAGHLGAACRTVSHDAI